MRTTSSVCRYHMATSCSCGAGTPRRPIQGLIRQRKFLAEKKRVGNAVEVAVGFALAALCYFDGPNLARHDCIAEIMKIRFEPARAAHGPAVRPVLEYATTFALNQQDVDLGSPLRTDYLHGRNPSGKRYFDFGRFLRGEPFSPM